MFSYQPQASPKLRLCYAIIMSAPSSASGHKMFTSDPSDSGALHSCSLHTSLHPKMPDQFGIYRLTGVFPRKLRKVSIESPILLPVRSFAGHHKARREKQTASGAPSQFVSVYPSPRLKPTGERVASCLLNPRKKRNVKTTGCGFMGVILQTSGLQEVTALSHKQTWPWIVLC